MKLIYCPKCQDLIKLRLERTECECGESWGWYDNDIDAVYAGHAIPIGIDNPDLIYATNHQPTRGLGKKFEAFVIPKNCETFVNLNTEE